MKFHQDAKPSALAKARSIKQPWDTMNLLARYLGKGRPEIPRNKLTLAQSNSMCSVTDGSVVNQLVGTEWGAKRKSRSPFSPHPLILLINDLED